jgi:3-oxoacyl-[acyl-carrier protein] reductase
VLVTGGTKSIGRAVVDAFVAEGAEVAFCARDGQLVKQREAEWRAKQARVQGAALDVTDDQALKKWIDGFAAEGGIDHFVANVSALGTEDSREGWRKAIDIDIVATVESVRHVWPHLLKSGATKQGGGSTCTIIGTVSLVEATAGPVMPYRSVKAALVPFMKTLAIEGASKGVRANMVSPGSIIDDGNSWDRQRAQDTERYKRALARNPMGRMGTPQEVANCVVFLAGAPASFVTGTNLIVDGAITNRVQY